MKAASIGLGGGVLGITLGLGACADIAFECQSSEQCQVNGAGQCQSSGYCSFPDPDCASGQRYGLHSGSWSGRCVDEPVEREADGDSSSGNAPSASTAPDASSEETSFPSLLEESSSSESSTEAADTTGSVPLDEDETSSGSTGPEGEPLDPDLVLWLEFTAGLPGMAPDSSTQAHGGSCEPPVCPVHEPGLFGPGARFDGIDDVIVVPDGPHFETHEGLTLATWLWLDAQPSSHQALLAKPVGTGIGNSWELYFFPNGGQALLFFAVVVGGIEYSVVQPGPFPTGRWIHLAATWDGAISTLWINGVAVGSTPAPALELDDQPILIGADDDHGSSLIAHLDGSLDDVRVYSRALDAEEIQLLFSPAI